jgi:LysM repeat protein
VLSHWDAISRGPRKPFEDILSENGFHPASMRRKSLLVFAFIFIAGNVMLAWFRNSFEAGQPTPLQAAKIDSRVEVTMSPTSTLEANLPVGSNAQAYVVKPGDTLFSISVAYGISQDSLASANQITDPAKIYAGESLVIPAARIEITSAAQRPTLSVVENPTSANTSPMPAPMPNDLAVNGVPVDAIVLLPESVIQHVREIYAQGQALGRNPRAFSKIGDSTIENPHFLARFDSGPYNLGAYDYLQPVIDYFHGSFSRQGVAVRRGLHAWSVLDPLWADKKVCMSGESPIACEFRLQNPSFVFIRLGSNDVGVPEMFNRSLRQIVEFCINNGVVPILGAKADRHEGSDINNEWIRRVAADYAIPLWDFDRVAQTLPDRGLVSDGVHMTTFFAHDYRSPVAYQRGHGIHNLTGLIALDQVWRIALDDTHGELS